MLRYKVTEITAQSEPVTVAEVRERLKLLPNNAAEEQYTLTPLIKAAREYCESRTGYAFVPQRITAYPDQSDIATFFNLPRPPIVEVESVILHGADGTDTETEEYEVDDEDGRMRLTGSIDAASLRQVNPVSITYRAGAETCPEMARQAMLLLIGHWYHNRESVQSGAVTAVEIAQTTEALLKQYRRWW